MGDRIFAPSTGEPPFESFSIVEDSDARKVIVLSPRGDGKLTLGCLFLLFFPAMFMTVPLVMSLIYGMDAGGWWLIVHTEKSTTSPKPFGHSFRT